jgi:hypothetical protein
MAKMKSSKMAIGLTLLLILFAVLPLFVKANFSPSPPYIEIQSPGENGYTTSEFFLNVTVKVYYDSIHGWEHRSIVYNLDGAENKLMNSSYQGVFWNNAIPFSLVTGEAVVSGVSDGPHNLTVYVKYNNTYTSGSQSIRITSGNPTITIQLPLDTQVFEPNSVIPYSINVNTPVAWFMNNAVYGKLTSIGYSLDKNSYALADEFSLPNLSVDKRDLTFTGNLSGLSLGTHELKAYVSWAYPKEAIPKTTSSDTTSFSISTQSVQPFNQAINALTIETVSGVIAASIVVFVSLLLYRRSHSKKWAHRLV